MNKIIGFTIGELLITLALMGVIAAFVIPKVVNTGQDKQMEALIEESFTLVGESYLTRIKDSAYADPAVAPEDIGGANANITFGTYLYNHLNYPQAINPTTVNAADYCNVAANYFQFHMGSRITSICSDAATNPDTMKVRVSIPKQNGTTLAYTVVIPENAIQGTETRYTTLYGFTGVAADCTEADVVLKVVNRCP